jgi:hypothetical protein
METVSGIPLSVLQSFSQTSGFGKNICSHVVDLFVYHTDKVRTKGNTQIGVTVGVRRD